MRTKWASLNPRREAIFTSSEFCFLHWKYNIFCIWQWSRKQTLSAGMWFDMWSSVLHCAIGGLAVACAQRRKKWRAFREEREGGVSRCWGLALLPFTWMWRRKRMWLLQITLKLYRSTYGKKKLAENRSRNSLSKNQEAPEHPPPLHWTVAWPIISVERRLTPPTQLDLSYKSVHHFWEPGHPFHSSGLIPWRFPHCMVSTHHSHRSHPFGIVTNSRPGTPILAWPLHCIFPTLEALPRHTSTDLSNDVLSRSSVLVQSSGQPIKKTL